MEKATESQITDILNEASSHVSALNELVKRAAKLNVVLTIEDRDLNPFLRTLRQWTEHEDPDAIEPRLIGVRAELVEVKRRPILMTLN